MKTIIDSLTVILPFLYAFVVLGYARNFFNDSIGNSKFQIVALLPLLVVHALYLILRTAAFDHVPITTIYEIMTLIAFAIAVVYLIIEYVIHVKGTGFFILLLSFVFQSISSLFIEDLLEVKPVLRNRMLGIHVSSALIGYVGLAIAAMYGFLYIMLYRNIKVKRLNSFYTKLPNLEILEQMTVISIVIGFIFLGIAIVIGIVWLPTAFEKFSYFDPKLVATVMIWLCYGIGLLAKRFIGLRGRRFMMLAIAGFLVSLFSLTVGNMYFSEFHNFY